MIYHGSVKQVRPQTGPAGVENLIVRLLLDSTIAELEAYLTGDYCVKNGRAKMAKPAKLLTKL